MAEPHAKARWTVALMRDRIHGSRHPGTEIGEELAAGTTGAKAWMSPKNGGGTQTMPGPRSGAWQSVEQTRMHPALLSPNPRYRREEAQEGCRVCQIPKSLRVSISIQPAGTPASSLMLSKVNKIKQTASQPVSQQANPAEALVSDTNDLPLCRM